MIRYILLSLGYRFRDDSDLIPQTKRAVQQTVAFRYDCFMLWLILLFSQHCSKDHAYRDSIRDLVWCRYCLDRDYRFGGVQAIFGFSCAFRYGDDYSRSNYHQSFLQVCLSLKLIPRQFISRSIYICKNNNPPHQMRNSRF